MFLAFLFAAAAAQPCVDIPFHWTPGQVEVQVSMNGRPPRWFVLDSGAEYHVIGADTVSELAQVAMIVRYPYAGRHKLFDGARDTNASPSLYGPQAMKTIATTSVAVGPTTLAVSSVRVFGAPSGSGGATETDALIGNELLQRSRVTFDYAHRRLLLAPLPR